MKKYLILIIGILVGALFLTGRAYKEKTEENRRLSANQRSLLSDIEFYRTSDSLSAASVERLTLTGRELERYNEELVGTIRDLGVKIKRLESASQTAIQTDVAITAPIRDSIPPILTPGVEPEIKPMKTFRWADAWISIDGLIDGDTVNCRVQSRDTLTQVVHRVPRRFLFIRYGTKAIRQEVVSSNPHSKITYTEYIELKN